MSPKVVDKEQRRKEIAQQALALFAERGFEAASLSQIAAAVGLKKATLYEYFSSKEELINASLILWMDEMSMGLEHIIADIEDPREKLRTIAVASVTMFEADPMSIQLMIATTQLILQSPPPSPYTFVREGFQRIRKDIEDIILQGIASGHFRPEMAPHAEKIAVNLLAYLDGIGLHYYFDQTFISITEQIQFYLDGLMNQLQKEPEPSTLSSR